MYKVYEDTNILFKILPALFLVFFFVLLLSANSSVFAFGVDSIFLGTLNIPDSFKDYYYLVAIDDISQNNKPSRIYCFVADSPILYGYYYTDDYNYKNYGYYTEGNWLCCTGRDISVDYLYPDAQSMLDSIELKEVPGGGKIVGFSASGVCCGTHLFNNFGKSGTRRIIEYFSNHDILDVSTKEKLVSRNVPETPYFSNKEDLLDYKFDRLCIGMGDVYLRNLPYLNFYIMEVDKISFEDTDQYYYSIKHWKLNVDSDYCHIGNASGYHFVIPYVKLGLDSNKEYLIAISPPGVVPSSGPTYELYNTDFGFYDIVHLEPSNSILTPDEEQENKENIQADKTDEQLKQLKENNETNKGIWQTIKDILSYINPFSENFFVYKLIELLIEALKSLFIPSEDFFSGWFSELNDSFAEQFGILYYPVSIIIEFLSSLDNVLVVREPIINVPAFNFNFFGANANVWDSFSYNFNDLLANESFKTAHNYYLLFVNVILTVGLIAFAGKVCTEIFGGVADGAESYFETRDNSEMSRYVRHQNVKSAYNSNRRQNLENNRRTKLNDNTRRYR